MAFAAYAVWDLLQRMWKEEQAGRVGGCIEEKRLAMDRPFLKLDGHMGTWEAQNLILSLYIYLNFK